MAVNWVSNTSVTILPVVWWERYQINCEIGRVSLGSSKVVHPPEKRAPQYFHPGLLLRCGIQRRCSSNQTLCCVPEETIFDCKINTSDIFEECSYECCHLHMNHVGDTSDHHVSDCAALVVLHYVLKRPGRKDFNNSVN